MASIAMLNYQVVTGTRRGGSFKKGHEYRKHFAFFGSCWWAGKIKLKWNEMKERKNELHEEWMQEWINGMKGTNEGTNKSVNEWIRRAGWGFSLICGLSQDRWPSKMGTYHWEGHQVFLMHICRVQSQVPFSGVCAYLRDLGKSGTGTYHWEVMGICVQTSDEWTNACMNECTFCRPHRPKVLRAPHFFFTIFMWSRAVATFSCTFCRPHLPKVLRAQQCLTIFIWNRALATVSCTFCRPHRPKVLRACIFFTVFTWNRALASVSCTFYWPHFPKVHDIYVKSSSCYSLVHLLRTSSSKNVPRPQFFTVFICFLWNWALATVSWTFLTSFSKSVPSPTVFYDFYVKSSSRYSLVRFCRRKQSPDFGDHGRPRYPKKTQGFAPRRRVFSRLHSRVPDLLHFPTTWWWCAWHDDVVDMMVRMLPMTIVRNSEVFKLNFLWPKGKWWIMIVAV